MDIDNTMPLQIIVSGDRTKLSVLWADGHESRYQADALHRACRSSLSVRDRLDGGVPSGDADIRITGVKPVGNYAVNLVFSDGRDRGIYPWSYLRDIDDSEPEARPGA